MDYESLLRAVCPNGKPWIIAGLADLMPKCIELASLTTNLRLAHFLAQVAKESDGLKTTVEYASGAAYEGRRDLGNVVKGDGVRFKGRGLIQVTGRDNYKRYGSILGVDLISDPTVASVFPVAALSAAVYWKDRNINKQADADSIEGATRLVNGGLNGLDDRKLYLVRAKAALNSPYQKIDAKAPSSLVETKVSSPAPVPSAKAEPQPAAVSEARSEPTSLFARLKAWFSRA